MWIEKWWISSVPVEDEYPRDKMAKQPTLEAEYGYWKTASINNTSRTRIPQSHGLHV